MEAPEGCPQIIYNLMKDVSIIEIYRNVSRDLDIPAVDLVFKYNQIWSTIILYKVPFHYVYYWNFSSALRLSTIDVKCESQF